MDEKLTIRIWKSTLINLLRVLQRPTTILDTKVYDLFPKRDDEGKILRYKNNNPIMEWVEIDDLQENIFGWVKTTGQRDGLKKILEVLASSDIKLHQDFEKTNFER